MKNTQNLFIAGFIFLFAVLGCSQATQVKTGDTANAQPVSEAKKYSINQTKTCGGLSVTVGEIAVESGKIVVGVTAVNNSKSILAFYPDQKNIVIGNKQIDANMFAGDGKISGEIQPGVEKTAALAYLDKDNKINPAEVKKLDIHFGDVTDMKQFKSAECDFTVELK